MRPKIIAVDIDGTVADSHTALLKRYNEQWCDTLRPSDVTGWSLHEFVKPQCGIDIYKLFSDPTLYEDVLPVEGAAAACGVLRSRGSRVIFVSSCFTGTADAKHEWLIQHGFLTRGPTMRDFVTLADKHLLMANVLIDDKPENLHDFGGRTLLFSQPWNRIHSGRIHPRVNNWLDVLKVLS